MKNKTAIIYLISITIPFFFGCRESVKEGNKNNASGSSISLHDGDENYFAIDTKQSVVEWKGSNLIGNNSHKGYISISKGELKIENGQLTGGTAEISMNTIVDEDHQSNNNLIKHLKDPDFFDVKKFPISTIDITESASKITGNLTIKGITHPVSFPAKTEVKDGIAKISGRLVMDRTKWNVRYKSGKFYDLLADQTISDSIEFKVKIVARK